MATAIFEVDRLSFGAKALRWAQQFEQFCYLQSNDYTDDYSSIEALLAVSASDEFKATNNKVFHDLEQFRAKYPNQWVLGFFSYDLKNELENLSTTFSNPLDFPSAYFFLPTSVIQFIGTTVEIEASAPEQIYQSILNLDLDKASDESKMPYVQVKNRMSKDEYFNTFEKMMSHIKRGDIYEVNLCQEFYAENTIIDPILTYERLNEVSPTPFSAFFKIKDKYIICASPERFLAKRGRTLISQPIKGTAPRGKSMLEDEEIKTGLKNNPKEIAENIMIVDLVRNDMTQSAEAATVTAEKILEVQSFK
ncbi:MAG: chorismate-binding protein, partial [Sphingobacterium sp.]|nr:chorismate-binding protein [Sphingobacterium sp.]